MITHIHRALFILGVVTAITGIIWFAVMRERVDENISDDVETRATTTDTEVIFSHEATSTEKQETSSTVVSRTKTSPPQRASVFTITFPYLDTARAETYYVPWTAPRGVRATVTLVQDGQKLSVVSTCENMPVQPDAVSYCVFTPPPLASKQAATGFALQLIVYDDMGVQIATAQTAPFASVSALGTMYPYKNTMYGWSIRYPQSWVLTDTIEHTVFSGPGATDEAFTIESCSLAREACVNAKDAFSVSGGTYESTLGGKRTMRRVTEDQDGYVRTDMLIRENILYLVTVRVLFADGTVRSPYVRTALASFAFDTPHKTITPYALDGTFTTGALYVERTNTTISFIRMYVATPSCKSEASADTFEQVSGSRFVFSEGQCRIEGRLSKRGFIISEDSCESFHADECTFKGVYTPIR